MRALIYIIQALSMLVTFVFLLRFWLPWVGADFRNALAQGILQITSPVINPIRRVVPSIGRIDTATVLVLFAIQAITFLLIATLSGTQITAKYILILSAIGLAQQSIRIFMFAIIIRAARLQCSDRVDREPDRPHSQAVPALDSAHWRHRYFARIRDHCARCTGYSGD